MNLFVNWPDSKRLIINFTLQGRHEKLLIKILRGTSDKNIGFEEFRKLLLHLGFEERIKGSLTFCGKMVLAKS
ncbi:hypothetical protein IMPR6_410007 [Imperialibacter sp. EC-SDR9]|nr:hypothetical protein IMPERIA75_330007 [Imperialibacter sp. 75]CAD5297344.1 hypothetical protein IMPERIA89_70057 [Imperialibacter sp. 89]VVT27045.1 hypothetical protein IMPR6_410007 [Imperialibacter sp. EC-SDR9]